MNIMVIDGNSILNRAFYGIKELTNSQGLHTNAIYGFLSTMLRLKDDISPDRIIVCFDVRQKTFRHLEYDGYKAQRKGMPDELAEQVPVLKDVLDALGIERYELAGYEADDIIGTISKVSSEAGVKCNIITGDKDSLQLISSNVTVHLISTKMGKNVTRHFDEAYFIDEYGFKPMSLIDFKALMGDSSDNIPGVSGVGEKTAKTLISHFGDIESLYTNLDDTIVKKSVRDKLLADKDMAFKSKWLATIKCDVEVDFNPSNSQLPMDGAKTLELMNMLGFKSFIEKLSLEEHIPDKTPLDGLPLSDIFITDISDVSIFLDKINLIEDIFILANGDFTALCISNRESVHYLHSSDFSNDDWCKICGMIGSRGIKFISNDIKGVALGMLAHGITPISCRFDISIAGYLVNPTQNNYSIQSLAFHHLNLDIPNGPPDVFLEFSTENVSYINLLCRASILLFDYLNEKIIENKFENLYYNIEIPLTYILADMQFNGIHIDKAELLSFGEDLDIRIDNMRADIYKIAGEEFNINSTKQLGEILFNKLGLKTFKKTKTGFSTDIEVLELLKFKHDIIPLIIDYRQFTKLKSTYVDGLYKEIHDDDRIHSSFNQTVTATGRLSSTEPNMQNIPIRQGFGSGIRKMFTATDDNYVLIAADYSQIELRVLAHISEDARMIEAFRENKDIHTSTAMEVFNVREADVTSELRRAAKAVNFGIVYGITEYSLAGDIGVPITEAKEYIRNYLETYKGIREYMANIKLSAKENGYVTTMFGRKRYIPEIHSKKFNVRSFGERLALNTPIQGSAADIIKIAMINVSNRIKNEGVGAKLILQVHDELIVECVRCDEIRAAKILQDEMQGAYAMRVPLVAVATVGNNWYETK